MPYGKVDKVEQNCCNPSPVPTTVYCENAKSMYAITKCNNM